MYELVADAFDVPTGLEHARFRLQMLTVDDVVKDFDAICSRVNHEGAPQPPFVPTIAQNLVDLGWHRRSSSYGARSPTRSSLRTRPRCSAASTSILRDARRARVVVVRQTAWDDGLDPVLEAAVREWVATRWPFERVTFGKRDP